MGNLSEDQAAAVRDYLAKQGMTYEPLLAEMADHIICDLEQRVRAGESYEAAWQNLLNEIPSEQLKTIQLETMETISKKQTLSKWFAYLSFFLLFAGSAFKLLKFPGAGQLLIASFIAMALALLTGSVLGVVSYREKRGGWLVLAVVFGILIFLASFIFQILHLPGATELRTMGVLVLCTTYITSFFLLRQNSDDLLPWLHQRYTRSIERFILVLFGAASLVRIPSLLVQHEDFVSRVLLLIVIAAAGLQFFSLTWHGENGVSGRSRWMSFGLALSLVCFLLPALTGVLGPGLRTFLIPAMFASAGLILLARESKEGIRLAAVLPIVTIIAVNLAWAIASVENLPGLQRYVSNALVLIALVFCFYPQRKDALMRMYITMAVAHYLFAYPTELGLW